MSQEDLFKPHDQSGDQTMPGDPPDHRFQIFVDAWDSKTPLDPMFYRWTSIRYGRIGIQQTIVNQRTLEIPEIFAYQQGSDRYLMYSPLAGTVAEVNRDALIMLETLRRRYPNPFVATMLPEAYKTTVEFLKHSGLLMPKSIITCMPRMYRTRVDLCLTSSCNMRCTYCFAGGGERPRFMNWEIAKTALDLTVEATLKKGGKTIEVAFQGDGEQFLAWPLMKQCTEYVRNLARAQGLDLRIWSLSNGILSQDMISWVIENLNGLAISLDGPPDVQNIQRPLPNGRESASVVMTTIRQFDDAGFDYSLRATISPYTAKRMAEITEFVVTNFPHARSLILDPLFPSYVSQKNGWSAPAIDDFVQGYIEAQKIADEANLHLGYTGFFNMAEITAYHCDAWGIKLAVTPEGLVSSCPIVATLEDPRSDFCIYGRYVNGKFEYNWNKLRRIMRRNLAHLPYCANCMVRWHCAGECYSRLMMVANPNEPWRSFRCEINRRLLPYELERRLARRSEAGG